ncbi:MAG: pyroglutamyl-peptidase I [Planctomycetia bacterium]|nr:pyroglutamyl-peptidase I [Planctomycetia bacterium]
MKRILITAFEPFDRWQENSSQLCLEQLRSDLGAACDATFRVYPVHFALVRKRLAADLAIGFDVAVHLGQAGGRPEVCLEAFALNVGGEIGRPPETFRLIEPGGPDVYRTPLPLGRIARRVRAARLPVAVSYHAGTYLCNATYYWSQHLGRQLGLATRSLFVHLPFTPEQAAREKPACQGLSPTTTARAVRIVLESLIRPAPAEKAPRRRNPKSKIQNQES